MSRSIKMPTVVINEVVMGLAENPSLIPNMPNGSAVAEANCLNSLT